MKIAIIGGGYVGLVSSACLASLGHEVSCIEHGAEKVAQLQRAKLPIYEPGLDELIQLGISQQRLSFSNRPQDICPSDVVIIAVGTPQKSNGEPDIRDVEEAVRSIVSLSPEGKIIIIKSTVPIGTAMALMSRLGPAKFSIISNPEFLREGMAVSDFMHPDRIVVGGNAEAHKIGEKMYSLLIQEGRPYICTNNQAAEMIKYVSNAYLAMRITFINEMADISEMLDADIEQVAYGVGLDARIGASHLKVGPGYGGSCFPKDVAGLDYLAQHCNRPSLLLKATIAANDSRKLGLIERVRHKLNRPLLGAKCAILGLTFKANTDDMRHSPSIDLINALLSEGAKVSAYDPQGMGEAKKIFGDNIIYSDDPYQASVGADILVIVTEWPEFEELDLQKLGNGMHTSTVLDLRNMFNPQEVKGVLYHSLGRGDVHGNTVE